MAVVSEVISPVVRYVTYKRRHIASSFCSGNGEELVMEGEEEFGNEDPT
jgi:hypothetical protein